MCTGTPRKTGVRGRGLDPGEAVSGETGICLKMTPSTSCVCSGDAANHGRASDLRANVCQHYTNTLSQVACDICRRVQVRTCTRLPRVSSSRLHPINKMPYRRDTAADGSPHSSPLTNQLVSREDCVCAFLSPVFLKLTQLGFRNKTNTYRYKSSEFIVSLPLCPLAQRTHSCRKIFKRKKKKE